MKTHRFLSLAAALGLFAILIPVTTSVVLAWSPPSIASVCSNDQAIHNWTVTLATESNYGIQWADNAAFTSPTTVTMHVGANSLSTPASVTTLYVRWDSDHNSKSSATWSGGTCSTPPPPPTATPFEAFQGETATPTLAPTKTPLQRETATPTDPATQTPFESFQGETATPRLITTPPPTSSGSDGSSSNSTPLFALLICLALGGLGLAAVEAQRRSIRS